MLLHNVFKKLGGIINELEMLQTVESYKHQFKTNTAKSQNYVYSSRNSQSHIYWDYKEYEK